MVICTGIFFNDEPGGEGVESSDLKAWTEIKLGKVKLESMEKQAKRPLYIGRFIRRLLSQSHTKPYPTFPLNITYMFIVSGEISSISHVRVRTGELKSNEVFQKH